MRCSVKWGKSVSSIQSVALAVVFYSALVFWGPGALPASPVEIIQVPETGSQILRDRKINSEKDKDEDEDPNICTV